MPSGNKKLFGGITADELASTLGWFDSIFKDWKELRGEVFSALSAGKNQESSSSALYWSIFYELPFHVHIGLLFELFGFAEWIPRPGGGERPAEALQRFVSASEDDAFFDHLQGLEDEEASILLAVLISATHTLDALSLYSCSLNQLVEKARGGDWEAFKNAIRVDPVSVSAPSMSRLLALGSLEDNAGVKRRLRSALKGPHSGRRPYSRLRLAQLILEEVGAMEEPRERIFELVVNQLRLYDYQKADAMKGLFSRFDAWRKESTK